MQFSLLKPQAGALLWVLDGDASMRGRLYEVNADGMAQYVSGAYFAANQPHFQEVWKNVMPVSARQMLDFQARSLIGPDLGSNGATVSSITAAPAPAPAKAPSAGAPAAQASGAAAQQAP